MTGHLTGTSACVKQGCSNVAMNCQGECGTFGAHRDVYQHLEGMPLASECGTFGAHRDVYQHLEGMPLARAKSRGFYYSEGLYDA